MDYNEWVIAKALLTPQLAFSMDYQMTHEEGDFGLDEAIQFYLEVWSDFGRDSPESFNKLLRQRGESNWKVQVVDLREEVPENLLTLNEIIQNPKQQTWVLWAFYPHRYFHSRLDAYTLEERLKDFEDDFGDINIEWPLYYVVTTESPQTIVWPLSDSIIPTLDVDDEIEEAMQFPLAFGWDHWDELKEGDDHRLLLSPSGGLLPIESYEEASRLRSVGLDDLDKMGLNLEQLQSQKLSALFQFLSGWRAFDVLEADKVMGKDSDGKYESKTGDDVAEGRAANGRSSLIFRNIINQSLHPVWEIRGKHIVSSPITPIFAVTLSVKKTPTFGTLNWKIDNLIWLLTPMT